MISVRTIPTTATAIAVQLLLLLIVVLIWKVHRLVLEIANIVNGLLEVKDAVLGFRAWPRGHIYYRRGIRIRPRFFWLNSIFVVSNPKA